MLSAMPYWRNDRRVSEPNLSPLRPTAVTTPIPRNRPVFVAILAGLSLVLAGCASQPAKAGDVAARAVDVVAQASKPSVNLVPKGYDGRFRTSYVLVGTFDGKTFTLTGPAVVDDRSVKRPTYVSPELTTPCPEPSGGWRPVDPAKATNPAFEATSKRAGAESGFGGLWIDQQYLDDKTAETEAANDPARFIVNVTTTGDVAAMERKLREIWGG